MLRKGDEPAPALPVKAVATTTGMQMTLAPLLDAPAIIKLHVAAIALAVTLAPVQLALPKGTGRHRLLGWIWVVAMATAASVHS
jgi:uncharacterized membrane protein